MFALNLGETINFDWMLFELKNKKNKHLSDEKYDSLKLWD